MIPDAAWIAIAPLIGFIIGFVAFDVFKRCRSPYRVCKHCGADVYRMGKYVFNSTPSRITMERGEVLGWHKEHEC